MGCWDRLMRVISRTIKQTVGTVTDPPPPEMPSQSEAPFVIDCTQKPIGSTLKIVHLSDLHFGYHHDEKLKHLKERLKLIRPDLVLITGDTVNEPSESHFKPAQSFIRDLKASGWETFVVPGNHDRHGEINLSKWSNAFDVDEKGYGCRFIKFGNSQDVTLILLNSVIRNSDERLDQLKNAVIQTIGSIDNSQMQWLRELKSALENKFGQAYKRSLKIVALHHHPIPTKAKTTPLEEAILLLENAGEVLEVVCDLKADLVLHGHQHDPMIQTLQRHPSHKPLTILGAGVPIRCSVDKEEDRHEASKSCSFFLVEADEMRLAVSEFCFANAHEFRNKFCPSRHVSIDRPKHTWIPRSLGLTWRIDLLKRMCTATEIHVFENNDGEVLHKKYPFTLGMPIKEGLSLPTFGDLNLKVLRHRNGIAVAPFIGAIKKGESHDWKGARVEYYSVDVMLNPPIGERLNKDVLVFEYGWEGNIWELVESDYFEEAFSYPFELKQFELTIEVIEGPPIRSLNMLPDPNPNKKHEGIFLEINNSWVNTKTAPPCTQSHRWKYVKDDIPARQRIFIGLARV